MTIRRRKHIFYPSYSIEELGGKNQRMINLKASRVSGGRLYYIIGQFCKLDGIRFNRMKLMSRKYDIMQFIKRKLIRQLDFLRTLND